MYRPPEMSARLVADMAMVAALRPHTLSTPLPIWIRSVCTAISASTAVASCPQPSATKKAS